MTTPYYEELQNLRRSTAATSSSYDEAQARWGRQQLRQAFAATQNDPVWRTDSCPRSSSSEILQVRRTGCVTPPGIQRSPKARF